MSLNEQLNTVRQCIAAAQAAPAYAPIQRMAHAEKALTAAVDLLAAIVERLEQERA